MCVCVDARGQARVIWYTSAMQCMGMAHVFQESSRQSRIKATAVKRYVGGRNSLSHQRSLRSTGSHPSQRQERDGIWWVKDNTELQRTTFSEEVQTCRFLRRVTAVVTCRAG